jgi:uncharacterized membrane protein YcjF (UPF0283 family)
MEVLCIVHQGRSCSSSFPVSSLAKQALNMEEPFTSPVALVNVFYMVYVVLIVAQHTQVLLGTNLGTYL